jgi:glycosyltransferase involved in cell wall biosynthesis
MTKRVTLGVDITPISVIIPVRNEGDRILQAVLSIVSGRSRPFPLEVVVIDDASDDNVCERVNLATEKAPNVRIVTLRLPSWSGIPAARNRGAKVASFPIYFITDGNTRFPLGWDLPIWRHFARHRAIAVTIHDIASPLRGYGCRLMLPSMGVSWIADAGATAAYVPVAACTGTIIDSSLFHHLGGFDETMPLYGAAEPEFSVRLWLSGYEILNIPELIIYHHFRPKAEHASFCASIRHVLLHNYLRFAVYYLPEDSLSRTIAYYRALYPGDIDATLSIIQNGDAWTRRDKLRNDLPYDFGWFTRVFAPAYDRPVPPCIR